MELRETFAKQVRQRRAAACLSQEALGDRAGLTRNYIGKIERGEASPTLNAVEAIARVFQVKPSDMLKTD